MEVGLSPGDLVVLDGDPATSQKGGRAPSPIFGPFLLWPNGWVHHDANWYGARPPPRGLCIRWGPSPPPQKGGGAPCPIFGKFLLCPNGWMHHDATWYGGKPQPRGHCVRLGPIPRHQKGAEPLANFRPISIIAKRLDGSRLRLAWRWALVKATLC